MKRTAAIAIAFMIVGSACSQPIRATAGPVGIVDFSPSTSAVVTARYSGESEEGIARFSDVHTVWLLPERTLVGGEVLVTPEVPNPLDVRTHFVDTRTLREGQEVVLMIGYGEAFPDHPWRALYAFRWPALSLVGAKGLDTTPAEAQLARLFKPGETTPQARLDALVELVAEQAGKLSASNSGKEFGPTPRSDMVVPPTAPVDPLDAFLAQPPEYRSIAPEDLPPGLDWEWVDLSLVVSVDPAIEKQYAALSFSTPHGVLMALGLPTGYHALPIDFPTVVGDPIQVSLIEPPQASPQFDNGYVVEKKRLVAVIPWPDIAEHRVFSIEIGANGKAVVSDTTESAYENAIDDIASP